MSFTLCSRRSAVASFITFSTTTSAASASHLRQTVTPTKGLARRSSSLAIHTDLGTRRNSSIEPHRTIPALPRNLRQSASLSTIASPEAHPLSSPWNDPVLQPHVQQLAQRMKARSIGLGLSGSQYPLESLQAAFPNIQQRQQVEQRLQYHRVAAEDFLSICKAFTLKSWAACQSFIEQQTFPTSQWPEQVLLHALEHVCTWPEADAALEQTMLQFDSFSATSATAACASLMDALCVETSALHLFNSFNDLLLRAAELLFGHETEADEELLAWQEEYIELLQDYVTHLTKWAEPRSRRAAVQIVDLVDRLVQAHLVSDEVSNRFRHLLCGISGREDLEHTSSTRTKLLQRERATFKEYNWGFLEDAMWGALAAGMSDKAEGQQLLFAAMYATSAARRGNVNLFNELCATIHALQALLPSSDSLWQAARIQYIRAILSHIRLSTADAIPLALRLLQQALPQAKGKHEVRLWRCFFRFGIERPDVDLDIFLNILSAAFDKNSLRQQLPSEACLSDGSLYEGLLSGLGRRHSRSKHDVQAGHVAWQHMMSQGIPPSPRSAMYMARLSILNGYWSDAFAMLKYLSVDSAADEAIALLEKELQDAGIRGGSYSLSVPQLPDPDTSGRIAQTADFEDLKWSARIILTSAVSARQQLACYPLWKYAPVILGAPFDAFSLLQLLQVAMRLTQEGPFRWDTKSPVAQARTIFRRCLLSQHPNLAGYNSAFEALRTNQSWLGKSEMQIQKWENWIANAWRRFTHQSSHQVSLVEQAAAAASVADAATDGSWIRQRYSESAIVFDTELFDAYILVIIYDRFLSREDVQSTCQDMLQVLSWMRFLEIIPGKTSLCYISTIIWDAMPPLVRASNAADEEAEGKPMGLLQGWCEEWIPRRAMPTKEDVQQQTISLMELGYSLEVGGSAAARTDETGEDQTTSAAREDIGLID